MRRWAVLMAVLGALPAAAALAAASPSANDYRGGWTNGSARDPQIYEFSIRGERVRGIYCTRCDDATTLAFVNGTLGPGGLSFVVTHVRDDGSTAYLDHATARFERGDLIVGGVSGAPGAPDGGRFRYRLHKDPRGPAPIPGLAVSRLPPGPPVPPGARLPRALLQRRARYVPPGPWEQLTPEKIVGVWIGFGAGITKQFFIIRKVGERLRGMVCGPCDNPYTMAALGDFRIRGDTLKFNILHEDWGPGTLPFHNQVTAHIADNEMRIRTQQNNMPPRPKNARFGASLMGPVPIEATAGND